MPLDLEKNIYGLSEGVFKACQFLGLKFPLEAVNKSQPLPSDYFGDDFELNSAMKEKLRTERKFTKEIFAKRYKVFSEKFISQKCFPKHTKTDLNIYFADHILFANKQNGASAADYFEFEFYNKSFVLRGTFRTQRHHLPTRVICNDPCAMTLLYNKAKTNSFFNSFLGRDWIYTRDCTFAEFKSFIEKHPRFFSKPLNGSLGMGAEIIKVDSAENIGELFDSLQKKNSILEEFVIQHDDIAAFCPDTVNTIRVYTILDIHNAVHILATSGRFGRLGGVVDNVHVGGGASVTIDPKTGIIISDGLDNEHKRIKKHPDTGKTFKGFQYPSWGKIRKLVTEMAKMIPQLRHIGWDIAITDKGEAILIEANGRAPDVGIQQAADSVGRLHLYQPLLEEIKHYKAEQMKFLGWRVNNLSDFDSAYNTPARKDSRLKFAISKLIPDCKSLIDLGCRKSKFVKSFTSLHVLKYYPVDFQKHDSEIIACDFNNDEFPDIKADAILCAFTAEYIEHLPQFLANMCNAAQKQILMLCRPVDKERYDEFRWDYPFLIDFTEEFLIKTMEQNNFSLQAQFAPDNPSVILYDFRRITT